MNQAIRYAAVTVAASLTSGSLVFAANGSAFAAVYLVLVTSVVFGLLAFTAAIED